MNVASAELSLAGAAGQSVSARFHDNGDGTVTDTRSGLMWSKDDASDDEVTHAEAEKACTDCRLGGFTDWRLPTVEELFLLADRSRQEPAIDTAAFPSCASDWYWTSTPAAASPSGYAWVVSFDGGSSGSDGRDDYGRVRAVRGSAGQ